MTWPWPVSMGARWTSARLLPRRSRWPAPRTRSCSTASPREPGLLKAKGRTTAPLGEWETTPGAALEAVLTAWNKLTSTGFTGDFALVLSNHLFAKLHRVNGGTGVLEIAQIRELVKTVVPTPALKPNQALLVATGPENLDIAIGQDIITAYLGPDGMDHAFRVFESLALRVKRPGAICTFE